MNLTQHAPRSPKENLHGIVTLPRFIDKVKALHEGTLGQYKVGPDSAVDAELISFLGTTFELIQEAILSMDENELIEWIKTNGSKPSLEEIEVWSKRFSSVLAKNDPARQAYITIVLQKMNLDPETTTTFDWIEADDVATFA